jgi:hypothetical protein
VYEAFDITVYDGNGEMWQPVGDGECVTVSISKVDVPENTTFVEVIRISDDPELLADGEDVAVDAMPVCMDADMVTWTTDHFTVYAIGNTLIDTDVLTGCCQVGDHAFAGMDGDDLIIYGFGDCWDQDTGNRFTDATGDPQDFQLLGMRAGYYTDDSYDNFYGITVDNIKVGEGITRLGDYMFAYVTATGNQIVLPDSLLEIMHLESYPDTKMMAVLPSPITLRVLAVAPLAITGTTTSRKYLLANL